MKFEVHVTIQGPAGRVVAPLQNTETKEYLLIEGENAIEAMRTLAGSKIECLFNNPLIKAVGMNLIAHEPEIVAPLPPEIDLP